VKKKLTEFGSAVMIFCGLSSVELVEEGVSSVDPCLFACHLTLT